MLILPNEKAQELGLLSLLLKKAGVGTFLTLVRAFSPLCPFLKPNNCKEKKLYYAKITVTTLLVLKDTRYLIEKSR